jgi:hypothetical protein
MEKYVKTYRKIKVFLEISNTVSISSFHFLYLQLIQKLKDQDI